MYYKELFLIQTPTLSPRSEPLPEPVDLVSNNGQIVVYIGVFLLIITIIIIAGLLNKTLEKALIISGLLTLILIPLLWFI